MKSSVNHEIDAARVRGATICGQCGPTGDNRHLWKPKFATDTMCTEEGKRILDRELAKYYPPPWTLHVDRHCQHLQEFLIDVMTKHCALGYDQERHPCGLRRNTCSSWLEKVLLPRRGKACRNRWVQKLEGKG